MGTSQSTESQPSEEKPTRVSESFFVDCEETEPSVTSQLSGHRESPNRRSSAEIRASWEAPTATSEGSIVGFRRSSSSEARLSSRHSRSFGGRSISVVEDEGKWRSSEESFGSRGSTSLVDSAHTFHEARHSLDPLPEEGHHSEPRAVSNDSARQAEEKGEVTSHHLTPDTCATPQGDQPIGLGLEQIIPLYCQLTGKTLHQLTQQDTLIIHQLVSNPQLLLQQLTSQVVGQPVENVPQERAVTEGYQDALSTPAVPSVSNPYDGFSEDQALLDAYQQPSSQQSSPAVPSVSNPYDGFSAEDQALLDAYQQPSHQFSTEDQALLDAYQQPSSQLFSPADQALLDAYQHSTAAVPSPSNPYDSFSAADQALLDAYQQPSHQFSSADQALLDAYQYHPSTSAVPSPSNPYDGLSPEEQALLDAYQQPSSQLFSPADQALLDAYQLPESSTKPNLKEDIPVTLPPSDLYSRASQTFISQKEPVHVLKPEQQLSPSAVHITQEEQSLLDAFESSLNINSNPFGALSREERAILGESLSSEETHSQSSHSASSSATESIMEPTPREAPAFDTSNSSFYSQEQHPAARHSDAPSVSNRSSGVRSSGARSSFADEARRIRPSMDIAGGQYTRASGIHGTSPNRQGPSMEGSHFSDGSSQYIVHEPPPEFPMTALPPMIPPPPPTEPPSNLLNIKPEQEMTLFQSHSEQPAAHDRMARLNIIRSSFAAERKSSIAGDMIRGVRLFSDINDAGKIHITTESLATELYRRYQQLAVVPNDVPIPLTLLCMLWGVMHPVPMRDAEACAWIMEGKRVMRVAALEDGSLWAMVNADHAASLKDEMRVQLPELHSRLINLYRQGFHDLALVPDDNYIIQNISYHLVEARRLTELASLLRDPIWLETKLRSYGTAPVVTDFRRYFGCCEDPDLNLMLRAFQISANGSLDHSTLYILKEQMLGRLMIAAEENPGIREWYEQGVRECVMAVPYRKSRAMPIHLLPKTPSLEQAGSLQRLILKGHTAGIHSVELAPNGLEVITASADGSIRVWDMDIGDFVLKMEDQEGPVTCFSVSKDGRTLVSGGEDGIATVYELPSGIWRHKLCGHTKRINAVSIDPHCCRAVTSSQDMTTRIWSLTQGTCLHVLSDVAGASGRTWEEWAGHHDMAISPDARIIATVDAEFRVRIWMLETANLTDTLEGHSDWVVSLSFAGDSGLLLTASHDKTLRLWNLWRGYCEHVFIGHRGRINNLRVTDDGTRAVSVSDDAVGIVWDVKEHNKVCELVGHMAWINDAAITQDGQRVITVSGDELGIVWDGNTGEALRILKGHSGEITGVSLSYKGRFAITASTDTTARVWDLAAPSTHLEDFHHGKVTKILYQTNDHKVVTIGEDRTILIWDLSSCKCTHLIRCQFNINFAFLVANGTLLVTASGDRCICVWDMDSGECIKKLPPHTGSRLKSISVSTNGKYAVIVLFDSTVTLWNLETMELEQWLMKRAERDGIQVHGGAVNDVVMTMEGRKAVTVSKDHTARLWDLEANATAMILRGHEDGVDLVQVKADGTLCMTASYDRTARLWDLSSGDCTMVLDHPKDIEHLVVDNNWQRAVTIAGETTAWLWDIVKGRCLGILESQGDHLCGAVFSPDGRFLATYSANSVVRVWTASSGKLRAVYLADTGISACRFVGASEINTLVVGDANGHVHFLDFPSNELASIRRKKHHD